MAIQRVGDLEIGQDLGFQRRIWVAQSIGWIAMLVITILGLVGFVGKGPFTGATAGSAADGFEIDYARVARHRADTQLVFTVYPQMIENGQVTLAISATYLEGIHVLSTLPQEPESVSIDASWVTYTFSVEDTSGAIRIIFDIEPMKNGLQTLEARVGDASPLRARQFIYP